VDFNGNLPYLFKADCSVVDDFFSWEISGLQVSKELI
jgi:hypothetical protein